MFFIVTNANIIFSFSFLVAPENVAITGPSKVVVGSDISLDCISGKSYPATSIHWSVTEEGTTTKKYYPEVDVDQMDEGSFVSKSQLNLTAKSASKSLLVECYGSNDVMGDDMQVFAHTIQILSKSNFSDSQF